MRRQAICSLGSKVDNESQGQCSTGAISSAGVDCAPRERLCEFLDHIFRRERRATWPPDTLIAQRSPLSQGVQPPRIDARPLRQEWNLRPGVSDCSAIKAARRIPIFSAFLASPRTFPLTISTGVSHAPAVTLRRPAPRSIGSDLRLLVN